MLVSVWGVKKWQEQCQHSRQEQTGVIYCGSLGVGMAWLPGTRSSAFPLAADKLRGCVGEMPGKVQQLILDHRVEVKGRRASLEVIRCSGNQRMQLITPKKKKI